MFNKGESFGDFNLSSFALSALQLTIPNHSIRLT